MFSITSLVPSTHVSIENPHFWAIADRLVASDERSSVRGCLGENSQSLTWCSTAGFDKRLELAKKSLNRFHPAAFLDCQPSGEPIKVPVTRVVAPQARSFYCIPHRPGSSLTEAMRFHFVQWLKVVMASAILLSVLRTHSVDQGINFRP